MNRNEMDRVLRKAVKIQHEDYSEEEVMAAAREAGIDLAIAMAMIVIGFCTVMMCTLIERAHENKERMKQLAEQASKIAEEGTLTLVADTDSDYYLSIETVPNYPTISNNEESGVNFYTMKNGKQILAMTIDPDGTIHTRGPIKEDLK